MACLNARFMVIVLGIPSKKIIAVRTIKKKANGIASGTVESPAFLDATSFAEPLADVTSSLSLSRMASVCSWLNIMSLVVLLKVGKATTCTTSSKSLDHQKSAARFILAREAKLQQTVSQNATKWLYQLVVRRLHTKRQTQTYGRK